jgi:hypothetical protein
VDWQAASIRHVHLFPENEQINCVSFLPLNQSLCTFALDPSCLAPQWVSPWRLRCRCGCCCSTMHFARPLLFSFQPPCTFNCSLAWGRYMSTSFSSHLFQIPECLFHLPREAPPTVEATTAIAAGGEADNAPSTDELSSIALSRLLQMVCASYSTSRS